MAMNIVTAVTTDDPNRSLNDLYRLKLSLDRQKLLDSFGDPADFKFYIITDYSKEQVDQVLDGCGQYKLIQFKRDEGDTVKDPSFYQQFAFQNHFFYEHDKCVFIDVKCYLRGLCQTLIYASLAESGSSAHSSFDFSDEEKAMLESGASQMVSAQNWCEYGDTANLPFVYMFHAGEHDDLVAKMNDESMYEYDTFWHFIEGEFTGVMSNWPIASVGVMHTNNEEANDDLVQKYEEVVRPQLNESTWRGHGGDMNELYISRGHEYRVHSHQTSIFYYDTTNGKPEDDRWIELWMLGY